MITKVQYKKLDGKGIRPFSVSKDFNLDILTENPSKEGTVKTFMKDGSFMGEPVLAKLQRKMDNGNFVQYGQGKGFMVRNEDSSGMWLIPLEFTKPISEEVVLIDSTIEKDEADTLGNQIQHDLDYINNNPEKKYLGFTARQLIVIAIALLIVKKI